MPVCPICTVAISGGVGLCRYLGIDDLISGVWIGALLFSLFWLTIDWLNKKRIKFLFRKPLVFIAWYGVTIVFLFKTHLIGQATNKFLGIDKLVFGILAGTIVFLMALWFEKYLRSKNDGRAYIKFQKVIIPVSALILLSLFFGQFCS